MGTNCKAKIQKFQRNELGHLPKNTKATIYISCVDTVQTRFDIAEMLKDVNDNKFYRNTPKYWLDFGNSQHIGQVILSTIGEIKQPISEKYQTVASLPMITDE